MSISIKFDEAYVIKHDEHNYLMLRLMDNQEKIKAHKFISELKNRMHEAVLKVYRNKRSLNANAYAWVLMGKLAAELNITTTEIYREYIRNIGDNFEVLSVPDDAVERWISIWESRGLGWVCDNLGPDIIPGHQSILTYYGSSVYDTKQMSNLLELIIADCKEQGIEHLPPEELERMKNEWEKREREH